MGSRRKLTRGERNIAWIEQHLNIPEGKFVGKPVRLSDKQKHWIRRIYDSPTRTFILSMGRKNAKTTFVAFLLLLHLVGPEAKQNSQLVSAAQSKDQAALLYELAAKMVRMSPDLSAYVRLRDTVKEMICPELGTFYKALSADVATSFGKSPAFTVHDELGQVKGPRSPLFEALETASAAQESPLSLIISTQAPTDADLLSVLIDDALTGADPTIKVELYTAPLTDAAGAEVDPFDEDTIRLANPHYDIFMNKEEVKKQARDAKRMPSSEAGYRNLILNQRVEARSPFMARSVWLENAGEPIDDFEGLEVYAGLDLSEVADLTALVLIARHGGKWNVKTTFWLPESGLAEKSRKDRVPYDLWAQQGWLKTTPGAAIEYEYVAEHLRGLFDRLNIVKLAFDRYNMRHLKPWLQKAGFTDEELEPKFEEFGQGYVSMSPALRSLEELALNRGLAHGSHPVLNMCAANAVVIKDPAGNRKLDKSKSTGRIDGMVALAMAVGVAGTATNDGPSVYEERGVLTF